MTKILRIVTVDNAEAMIAAGGSAAWYGRKDTFEAAAYFIAVEKGSRKPFLIAEIDDVVPVPESGPKRWSLQFVRYAEIDPERYHPDTSSNPIIGMELETLLPGLSLEQLEWREAPPASQKWSFSRRVAEEEAAAMGARALTIAEAKRGLSLGLGVRENQIDIIVRA